MSRRPPRRVVHCPECGQRRAQGLGEWCSACARRWIRAGRPAGGPPPPEDKRSPEHVERLAAGRRAAKASRVEDYADLLSFGLTREEAAARLRVTVRSTYRYDRALNETSTT